MTVTQDNRAGHAFDYVYAPGRELRPAPSRAGDPAKLWRRTRELNLGQWMKIEDRPPETKLNRLMADHFWQGDSLMDPVVERFREIGMKEGRAMLDQALDHGIDSVENPPAELVRLFSVLDNPPDWHDPAMWEYGRQLYVHASTAGKLAMGIQDFMATFVGTEVSSAVGATGRFVNNAFIRNFETSSWFRSMTVAGAMDRYSPEFKDTIRVRFMHCQVRAGLRSSWGDEHFAQHGNPISTTSIMAAALGFGLIPLLFDHAHGRRHTVAELHAVLMYWSYIGYVFGGAEELVPKTVADALAAMDFEWATGGGPTEWTTIMAQAGVKAMGFGSGTGLLDRVKILLVTPVVGAVSYFCGEPFVRALLADTPLRHVRLSPWDKLAGIAAQANVTALKWNDRLPGAQWRKRRRLARGDAFWNRATKLNDLQAKRRGIRLEYTHHDRTADTPRGCPIAPAPRR